MEDNFIKPKDSIKLDKNAYLQWTFENTFNLTVDEILIYVNSMATSGSETIEWELETNAYRAYLEDKKSNVIKLELLEHENFFEFITLKLVMDPSRVDSFFNSSEKWESQIHMTVKFKSDENLKQSRIIEWIPNAKKSEPKELSFIDKLLCKKPSDGRIFIEKGRNTYVIGNKEPQERKRKCPLFRFIIAIDETAEFSKGSKGSIQPKLREAVNKLIKKLVTRKEAYSIGLVVVRFGGIMHEESRKTGNEGPFHKQVHGDKSIYEFAPFPDAKLSDEMFEEYVKSVAPKRKPSEEILLPPLPPPSDQPQETTSFLNDSDVENFNQNVFVEKEEETDNEEKTEVQLDFMQARRFIHHLLHFVFNFKFSQDWCTERIDFFVSTYNV